MSRFELIVDYSDARSKWAQETIPVRFGSKAKTTSERELREIIVAQLKHLGDHENVRNVQAALIDTRRQAIVWRCEYLASFHKPMQTELNNAEIAEQHFAELAAMSDVISAMLPAVVK